MMVAEECAVLVIDISSTKYEHFVAMHSLGEMLRNR